MSGEDSQYPWVQGNLQLRKDILDAAEKHALECYPSESCGWMSGPASEPLLVDTIQKEINEADKYHKLDPERFPRDSKTYFKINELRAARAFEEGFKSGQPIKIIYHSHCDAGAYFSQEDSSTFASEGELMWPCAFLVISVQQGKIIEHKLWTHIPGSNEFQASSLQIV